jgi:hypothetical protein
VRLTFGRIATHVRIVELLRGRLNLTFATGALKPC